MNKILTLVLALVVCVGLFSSCKNSSSDSVKQIDNGKINIVCTTFPQYDWVREIIGNEQDKFELTLLLDNNVDLHNYQPTAADIAKIGMSDIFIYIGGESDGWVEDALGEASSKDIRVINLLDALGDAKKEEEIVEGMEGGEEHEHNEEHENNEEHGDPEYDEHVWLSVKNAKILVSAITDAIQDTDPENEGKYAENSEEYTDKLEKLDGEYEQVVQEAAYNTVLFGDRFPFRYLVDDYGLNYYAAFVGCSAESEASFETITFLSKKVDEYGIPVILVIENSDQKIAETIVQNTKSKNQDILVMNSLQSITNSDISKGSTYLKAMQDNLEILRRALN